MGEYLKKIITQVDDFMKTLTPAKKISLGVIMAVLIAGVVGMFIWAGDTAYQPLMSNLNPEDSANVIRILRDKKIPFKVDPTGKMIEIPARSVYEFRLELATMGLPQSGVSGYELFDKSALGTSSFVQSVNQKRALEGELIRTIQTIKGVKRARVHLTIPKKSTFIEDQAKPSASVVIDIEPGSILGEKQIYGVGNLIAKAVEGLEISDVVIVDSSGRLLSKNNRDPMMALTANQLDFQRKLEEDLEKRVENMLARVVGEGKVVARVSAELDFSQTSETQTTYDADGSAVRSMRKDVNDMVGTRPGPSGVPGAKSNTPDAPAEPMPMVNSKTNKNYEVANYEIPQTVKQTKRAPGSVNKLSVAVVVDGKHIKTTDKDGKVTSKVEPWNKEKLAEFETIVAGALGINKKRGDTLEIKTMEFNEEDFSEAERLIETTEKRAYLQNMIVYSVIGGLIFLFFLFVVRPFIKWVTENTIDSVDSFLPQTIEELEKLQKNQALPGLEETVPVLPERMDPEKVEGEMIKEKIVTLVDSNPHKAALILKDWLKEPAPLKKSGEKKDEQAG